MTPKEYKDIAGWQKHMRRTAQDQNLSKSTRRKINYRIGLLDRLVHQCLMDDKELARNQFDQPVCTPERPWREGDETPVVHPLAREVGEQMDGWPGGDIVRMECPTCGTRWKKELPQ